MFSRRLLYSFKIELSSPAGLGRMHIRLENRESLVGSPAQQISFRGLMIVFAKGFIPLYPLVIVSTIHVWESSQWAVKNHLCAEY